MILFTLSFLLGDLWLQTFAELPFRLFIINLSLIAIFFLVISKKYLLIIPLAFIIGFLWSAFYAYEISSWTLKKDWEGKPLLASGYIFSLPYKSKFGTSFELYVNTIANSSTTEFPNTLIQLTLPENSHIHPQAGDNYQLQVKLKRIHGSQNPGAFDYEAWAFQKGIRASGTVIENENNKILKQSFMNKPLMRFRQFIHNQLLIYSPQSRTSPWLTALILGERHGIPQSDWQVLRNTGTNHLMVIGGLHIGILAGFSHFLFSWLWRRSTYLPLLIPAQHIGACAALITAVIYSSLSGFSIPTQRASIMLAVFIITVLSNRKINAWNAWSLALLCVLLMNPMSVLTESFWLSFATIALIIYGMSHRLHVNSFWWKWGRVQWVIGFGLIPLTLALFQECSLISFAANSISIPWLGFAILPLCFLSAIFLIFSPTISSFLLLLADKSLSGLWFFLTWISHLKFSAWHIAIPNIYLLLIMIIGFLLLLIPSGLPGRILGVIWVLPVLLYQPAKPRLGEYWLTMLDVGQGLSVVIQTAKHTLVYDAGPKYNASFDLGESVVLPFLRKSKTEKIDMLVISHADNDHIGGAQAILNAYPDTIIKTSAPEKFLSADFCKLGDEWEWDKIKFRFLYPVNRQTNSRNDNSCVLMIDNGQHKALLAGDIEKIAENKLLELMSDELKSDIIIAPHHGSKTSGMEKFVNAVNPEFVLYATGYRNRYHFPHPSVLKTYEKIHAKPFNSVDSGAIRFVISPDGKIDMPERYRVVNKKYWFD